MRADTTAPKGAMEEKNTKKKSTLSDKEIAKLISQKTSQAVGFCATNIANRQEEALKLYMRDPLVGDDKIRGKSKWVDSSVLKHVEWLKANIADVFSSANRVVEFLPNGPEDEKLAGQMTDVANFLATTVNSHECYLDGWLFNGTLTGQGIVTITFEAYPDVGLPELVKGLNDVQLVEFQQQSEAGQIEIEEQKQYMAPGPMGEQRLWDLKIRKVKKRRSLCINNLKPEDFIVSKDAEFDQQTGGIKAALQGHKRIVARDDLIEMGFDPEKVKKIPKATDKTTGIALERSEATDNSQGVGDVNDDVAVYEIFTKMAVDGEKRRHWRFTLAGELDGSPVLLHKQEVSKYYPYAAFCPFPLGNTLFGQGIADRVGMDQRLLSQMTREQINNLRMATDPMKIVNQDVTNMDDARNLYPGATIRSEAPDGGIKFLTAPFTAAQAQPIMDALKQELDFTTGVGAGMSAVNASDMQDTTATAANLRANSSQLLVKQVCRNFAATGYRYMFRVIIDLLAQNPEDAEALIRRLTNDFVPVDAFDPDFDIRPSVAFGVLNKDAHAASLANIFGLQQQIRGLDPRLVTNQQLYHTATAMIENAGRKDVAAFITDPSTLPPPPPPGPAQPDANTQGLIQLEREKAQLKAKADETKANVKMIELRQKSDLDHDKMDQDALLKAVELLGKYGVQVELAQIEHAKATQRNDVDQAIAQQQARAQVIAEIMKQQQAEQAPQPQPQMPPQGGM